MGSLKTDDATGGQFILLKMLIAKDPVGHLPKTSKEVLFKCRQKCKKISKALPLFLRSIDWTNPLQIIEAYKLLHEWKRMDPEHALCLLEDKY